MPGDDIISRRLTCAVGKGDLEEVRQLISSYGLPYPQARSKGYVFLRNAVENKHTEIAKLLLTSGSSVNSKNPITNTPLHFAAINCDVEIVEMLLDRGANINAQNKYGITPLHNAVKSCGPIADLAIFPFLISWRPSISTAIKIMKMATIELLLKKGAYVNATNWDGITPLHLAAEKGSEEMIKLLLKHGANVNSACTATYCKGYTPLCIAAKGGHEEVVKLLLEGGANVNAEGKDGKTALHFAVEKGHEKFVQLLLECGANVDAEDKDGKTVLHLAVEKECSVIIEHVLKHCPDVNNKSNRSALNVAVQGHGEEYGKIVEILLQYGFTVSPEDVNCELLHAAVEKGYVKIVEELLKYGIDVNKLYKSTYGECYMPLHVATENRQEEVAKLLISYGADVNAQDGTGKTPIFYATENADLKITELLLTNKANVKDNPELLNVAVKKGCREIVEVLLELGADVNTSDECGRTALHFTALGKDQGFLLNPDPDINVKGEIAKLLLSMGANVNAQTKDGITTLHAASQIGYVKVVEALLEYNADVNCTVKTDRTPLHIAARNGHLETVEVLLKFGASIDSDECGCTPLYLAVRGGHEEVVKLLLESGANVNAQDKHGKSVLHLAVEKGQEKFVNLPLAWGANVDAVEKSKQKCVRLLLECGANFNAQDKDGKTALHFAVEKGQEKFVKLLLEYGGNVDAEDKDGKTALHIAVEKGYTLIIEHILKHCPDVNNRSNRSALNVALCCYGEQYDRIFKNLLQYGFTIKPEDVNKCRSLHAAVRKGYLIIVQLLISYGADVNAQDETGKTPIFYATENTDLEITKLLLTNKANIKDNPELLNVAVRKECRETVEVLLSLGADVNTSDKYGRTALHYTALEEDRGFLLLFRLPKAPNINVKGEIAKLLLIRGANVNAQTEDGITTLHAATQKGYVKVVEALLEHNADVNCTDKTDKTPLHIAAQEGHPKIVKGLLKFGASIDSKDGDGRTALHIASKAGHEKIVIALLEHGSDINIMSKNNETPLDFAMAGVRSFYEMHDFELYHDFLFCSWEHIAGILKRHMVKMETANLYVSEKNLLSIRGSIFQDDCEEEIASIKSEKVSNANVSFYDILTKDINQLAMYAGNESIVQILRSDDYKIKFPIYASMINCSFRKGERRRELLEQGNKIFHFLFGSFAPLPPDCTEKIFSYVSDGDLRIFIEACKPISVSSPNTDINNVAITSNIPKIP